MLLKVTADKISSSTINVPMRSELRISSEIIAEEGYIVAGKIIGEKNTYNTLENCDGRMVSLHDGDIIVGALGHRNALHGYSGFVPEKIASGDILNVLNLGGVIGKCTSFNKDVGAPFQIEILGSVQVFPEFETRTSIPAHVKMNALGAPTPFSESKKTPIVFIAGTCMNAGKTYACCKLIREFAKQNVKVAACKLTGVSLLRDVLTMKDYGAQWSASFVNAGIVTTSPETAVATAETILSHLSATDADVIIAELGDGIMGLYGVDKILEHKPFRDRIGAFVVCASDPVGSWGAVKLLQDLYGIETDVLTGPATDNKAGTEVIERLVKVAAFNARNDGERFAKKVLERVNRG